MEKEMVTYSSIFAWEIPQTEEPGRLQSLGSQSVQYDWTRTHYYSFSSPLGDYRGSSQGVSGETWNLKPPYLKEARDVSWITKP